MLQNNIHTILYHISCYIICYFHVILLQTVFTNRRKENSYVNLTSVTGVKTLQPAPFVKRFLSAMRPLRPARHHHRRAARTGTQRGHGRWQQVRVTGWFVPARCNDRCSINPALIFGVARCEIPSPCCTNRILDEEIHEITSCTQYLRERRKITYLFTNFSQRALHHVLAPRDGDKRRERMGRKGKAYEFEATRERHAAKFTSRTCSTANTPATNPTDRRRSYASYLSQVRLT